MIPLVLQKGIEPVAPGKTVIGERQAALRLLPQIDFGDILSARVESRLPDGSHKVMVAGQQLRMVLPFDIASGESLELTFLSREPRLTFMLKDTAHAASTQAPAPQLSAAGRLVAVTMLQPGELALPVAAAAKAPLLAAPPADGAHLAPALARTLADSGMFYESHQAEWVSGRRELAQIRGEPQARLTQVGIAAAAIPEPPTAVHAQHREQSIDPRTVPLVQQQLAVLDSARMLLQIEIWPRQWMQWEIEEHQPGSGHSADAAQVWNTRLWLNLPQLGALSAALSLSGDSLRIRLETENAENAALLHEHRASLQAALTGARLPPASVSIAYHEQH